MFDKDEKVFIVFKICDISDSARCFNFEEMHTKIDRLGGYPKDRPKCMLMAVYTARLKALGGVDK